MDVNSHGTKFVIFEPEEQIINLVNDSEKDDGVNDSSFVRTSLVGFTNQFQPKEKRLPVVCRFPVFKDSDQLVSKEFSTSDEEIITY